ncbi:MAG: polysaccharide biosynthesis/export family protein [Pyrinomonadaceae bacterium]
MYKSKAVNLSILIIFIFLLEISLPAQTAKVSPDSSEEKSGEVLKNKTASTAADDLIHFGDLIDVDVIGSAEYDWRGKLSPEGFLTGINYEDQPVYGLCRTEEDVAEQVAKGLTKILKKPVVKVKILDRSGRPVSFLYGAVKSPQRFQIRRAVNLNELIIISGGFTENASGEIQILRPPNLSCQIDAGEKKTNVDESLNSENLFSAKQQNDSKSFSVKISDLITGKPDANPLILPGDIVSVIEAQPVYITGGVTNPKQINLRDKLTLTRAIAAAGGFTRKADPKKIIIFRRNKVGTETINIDFDRITASEEEDIVLQALDIVEIPQSGSDRRRFTPVINVRNTISVNNLTAPLRVID